MSLVEHIEGFLGPIDEGWKLPESSSGIKVVGFRNKPFEGAVTYVTLGLSDHLLSMNGGRSVREELVLSAYEAFPSGALASFLVTFSEYLLAKRRALLRGDVVGPSDSLIPEVSLNAVYSAIPVIFEDGFATYGGTAPPTVLVWLIPLHAVEAEFVKKNGWNQFEDILEAKNPDLWDLKRPPVI